MLKVLRGCPNCYGEVEDGRLKKGLPCESCLPQEEEPCQGLQEAGTLDKLSSFCDALKREEEFRSFFKRALGSEPWSLQRQWARRVFMGESFAMVAPVGVGKTTFGSLMALFLEGRALMVFPTRLLATQVYDRIRAVVERGDLSRRVFLYRPSRTSRKKLEEGDFDLLIGTNAFLQRNFEVLKNFKFSFIFVDDIDSFLKGSRGVRKLFELMGFSPREIEEAAQGKLPRKRPETVLVISSATLRPRGKNALLFRNLLGMEVQRASSSLRNILDIAERVEEGEEALKRAAELIRKMGSGGLVFVSILQGLEGAERARDFLKGKGINCVLHNELPPEDLRRGLETGEIQVAVGISHSGNPLVRGLDLPHAIRYVVHLDVPRRAFPVRVSLAPAGLMGLILALMGVFEGDQRIKALAYLKYLKKYSGIREEVLDRYPGIKKRVREIAGWLEGLLAREDFRERVNSSPDVSMSVVEGEMSVVVADAASYIQSTGRASRLVAGMLTRGISLLFWDDEKAFTSLKKRLSYYFPNQDVEFKTLEEVDLKEELRRVDEDRERAKAVLSGKVPPQVRDLFRTTLVVVESPNKARTIAGFFGKPQTRMVEGAVAYDIPLGERLLTITASLGHILDLVVERGFFGVEEVTEGFIPVYDTIKSCTEPRLQHTEFSYLKERCRGEIRDKISIIDGLRKLAFQSDEVFVATDPDSEGEKIAYDLFLHLRPYNSNISRAEFHEVRPGAFKRAVEEPRDFSESMVKAQMVRRVVDRWVGFVLSRVLWRVFSKNWFSAGRVQTPVLGWIIQREAEARRKKSLVEVEFGEFSLRFEEENLALARRIQKNWKEVEFRLEEQGEEEVSPPPPFSTDAVLEEAGAKLKFSARKTMNLLQELFEKGFITYHRTDSTRVSEAGKFSVAKPYIVETFGEEYFHPRTWGHGGAHECIRPTRALTPEEFSAMVWSGVVQFSDASGAIRLYALIFRRFMASQMRPVKVKKARLCLEASFFSRCQEVNLEILQDGFNRLIPSVKTFPPHAEITGVKVRLIPLKPLFTQGSLVAEMKRRGLGRPSTYAHIIQTLLERGYVREVRGKLKPTPRGRQVYSFLRERYPEYISEELTRRLEEVMDRVERGEANWQEVLRQVYEVKNLLQ